MFENISVLLRCVDRKTIEPRGNLQVASSHPNVKPSETVGKTSLKKKKHAHKGETFAKDYGCSYLTTGRQSRELYRPYRDKWVKI